MTTQKEKSWPLSLPHQSPMSHPKPPLAREITSSFAICRRRHAVRPSPPVLPVRRLALQGRRRGRTPIWSAPAGEMFHTTWAGALSGPRSCFSRVGQCQTRRESFLHGARRRSADATRCGWALALHTTRLPDSWNRIALVTAGVETGVLGNSAPRLTLPRCPCRGHAVPHPSPDFKNPHSWRRSTTNEAPTAPHAPSARAMTIVLARSFEPSFVPDNSSTSSQQHLARIAFARARRWSIRDRNPIGVSGRAAGPGEGGPVAIPAFGSGR